jgi:hypothetical protein
LKLPEALNFFMPDNLPLLVDGIFSSEGEESDTPLNASVSFLIMTGMGKEGSSVKVSPYQKSNG